MNKHKLKHLVIKPTLSCTANCPTCGSRKILHHALLRKGRMLKIDDWEKVLIDANYLNLERLDISGGEPTLFKDLERLVAIGRKNNWFVNMNTNGSLIKKERVKELVKSGLNNVYVSLYSHNSEKHDLMRGRTGLWNQAVETVKLFAGFQNKKFTLKAQTLIDKMNYKDLPGIIKLNIDLGVTEIAISYLEGDINKKLLLEETEIQEFRENIIPKCIDKINTYCSNSKSKKIAIDALNNMFSNNIPDKEWSLGIYRPKKKKSPKVFKTSMVFNNLGEWGCTPL